MRYLLAILLPPLAILLCGKIFQFMLMIILYVITILIGLIWFVWWIPILHAILVVHSHLADQRSKKLIKAVEKN